MRPFHSYIVLLCLLFSSLCLNAAESDAGMKDDVHFRLRYVINIAELDSTFVDNSERMKDIRKFLSYVSQDSLIKIDRVDFRGTASPDGSYEFNVWLSENRLRTFKELVKSYIDIPDSIIFSQSSDIPWNEFRDKVEQSNVPMRETVLTIIDEGPKLVPWVGGKHIDHRLLKLKRLDGGNVWNTLKKPILFDLRYGDATFYFTRLWPGLEEVTLNMNIQLADEIPELLPLPAGPQISTWIPRIYLKTNLIGWAMGSVNLAAEFDLGPHWSITLPAYYCAWDYFKSTIKFRNLTFQPELRYWPNAKGYNHGFFIGAHFGMMYYNFAVDGSTRFQDYRGRTPALGGGVGLGFRKAISSNQRWHIEFTAGAGAYRLDYSKFYNTPDVKDGQWYARKKKTFIGLDQAAITISYSFPLTKYERIRTKGGEL